jgi:large subunit ribosomal protein L9
MTISIARVLGPNDVLIGPVTAGDIADALSARYDMDRRKILLDEPIHAPGEYTVRIRLHRDVVAETNAICRKRSAIIAIRHRNRR